MKSFAEKSPERTTDSIRSGEFPAYRPRDPDLPMCWTPAPNAVCDTITLTRAGETFDQPEGSGQVFLVDGEVAWVSAEADLGTKSFVERLITAGLTSVAELELVFSLCRVEGIHVCEALTRLGLVEPAALRETLRAHMRETLQALLAQPNMQASWTQSHLAFEETLTIGMGELLEPTERRAFRALCVESGGAPARTHDEGRIPLRRTAMVDTVHGPVSMTTVDFSLAGASLRARSLVPIASKVVVHINVAGAALELPGRVVRFDRGTGREPPTLVVLWTELSDATERALTQVWAALY